MISQFNKNSPLCIEIPRKVVAKEYEELDCEEFENAAFK